MPTKHEYSLQDLAVLGGVTARTIRYYIAQGLLSAPDGAGPAARYGDGHLARLQLIRQLQRQHLPLAEIRARLAGLSDDDINTIANSSTQPRVAESAIDYIQSLLGPKAAAEPAPVPSAFLASAPAEAAGPHLRAAAWAPTPLYRRMAPDDIDLQPTPPKSAETPEPDRSQWDRVVLAPDIELHVRRPLGRLQNKRVERLITIARQLLEEDPS